VHFEQEMQHNYLEKFGIDRIAAQSAERSPTCLGYTSFLLAEAQTGSYETLLAALLPCFSIYADIGTAIAGETVANNPFALWIETYASSEFQVAVDAAEAAANRAAETAHADLRRRMLALFRRSIEFEWMFWDAAYRLEVWPTIAWR
jgi:thiaminase/transcriptional activator TenA